MITALSPDKLDVQEWETLEKGLTTSPPRRHEDEKT